MSPRAVIYARYSTDHQSEASIEDQLRICRRLAEARGWTVTGTYTDAAISGAVLQRPEFQRLISDAGKRRFDTVVSEGLDRISRDQEHVAGFYKQMVFLGIPLITVAEGEINELHIGLKGTMSALFLKDLAIKTHRGLEGRVREGKSGGGLSYGYRAVRHLLENGEVQRGDREIIQTEAEVIQRIFEEYIAGHSAREIASGLNDDGIPAPDSAKGVGSWGPSTISGNHKRGTGILNNELYIGRMVWNRLSYIKDPATQKRVSRLNLPEEWIITDVPDLRIISNDLWDAAKLRQSQMRELMNLGTGDGPHRPERTRRPDYLFSGLMRCACCGAGYTLINKNRYGCAASRAKGKSICTNRSTILREEVEARVLLGLQKKLMHPKLIAAFVKEYVKALNEAAGAQTAAFETARRDLAATQKKIDGIIEAITDGMYHPSMKAKMTTLEATKARLTAELAERPEPPTLRLHPSMAARYSEEVERLSIALYDEGLRFEAMSILRSLIDEIRMIPDPSTPAHHKIELVGDLAGILHLMDADSKKPPAKLGGFGSIRSDSLVAGTGFEPVTFRL